jgi:pimeloyl-ACP methyl ester carboxylesterase
MNTLNVPGAKLSYEVEGSGPLLILIPGASGVGEVFRKARTRTFSTVSGGDRTFAAVFPGANSTDLKTLITGSRPMPMMSGARSAHLTDKPATIFGYSSGAIVALARPHPLSRAGPDGGCP